MKQTPENAADMETSPEESEEENSVFDVTVRFTPLSDRHIGEVSHEFADAKNSIVYDGYMEATYSCVVPSGENAEGMALSRVKQLIRAKLLVAGIETVEFRANSVVLL